MTALEEARETWERARDALCEVCKDIPYNAAPTANPYSMRAREAFTRWWRLAAGDRKPRRPWEKQ